MVETITNSVIIEKAVVTMRKRNKEVTKSALKIFVQQCLLHRKSTFPCQNGEGYVAIEETFAMVAKL